MSAHVLGCRRACLRQEQGTTLVTCGIPSQSSACCMASRALSTGLDWSHWSQSGHRPAGNTGRELELQPSDTSSQASGQKVKG